MDAFDVFAQLTLMQMLLVICGIVAIGRGHVFTALIVFTATCFI